MSDEVVQDNSESQESGEQLDSTVQDILDRSEETPPAQPEGQGEEDGTYELTEDQYNRLTQELNYTDDDLDEFTPEEVSNILEAGVGKPTDEQMEETPPPVDVEKVIITPEMAANYGFAKSLIGKPFSETFKTIDNQNKHIQRITQDYNEIKSKLTETGQTKAEELLKTLKSTDPVDLTKEEFAQRIDELVKVIGENIKSQVQSQPSQEQIMKEFFDNIQTQIPAGMKAEETFNNWWASLTPQEQGYYVNLTQTDPNLSRQMHIIGVRNYALMSSKSNEAQQKTTELEEERKEKDKKARVLAAKMAAEAIKKSKGGGTRTSKFNTVTRTTEDPYKGLDVTVAEILKRAAS